jgi:hypothetical protein
VMQDGPIAYFRFEEQSGTSCKNEVAESPVQCTYTTGPFTLGAPGISGSSVNLGSTEARIDITIPSPLNGTTPFSVEAWVNVHGFGSSLVRNAVDSSTSTRTGQWVYWDTQKRIVTETWSEGTHLFYTTSSSPQPLGEFVHIVYMYSDTEEQDVLYVDGVRGVGERLSDKVPTQLKMSLVWGGFTGLLDEVALYRKVLSPERIAAHYAARSNR